MYFQMPSPIQSTTPLPSQIQSLPASPKMQNSSPIAPLTWQGTKPSSLSSFNTRSFSGQLQATQQSSSPSSLMQPLQPSNTGGYPRTSSSSQSLQQQIQKPNYNIALAAASPAPMTPAMTPMAPMQPSQTSFNGAFSSSPFPPAMSSPSLFATPPGMAGMLTPSKPAQPSWNSTKQTSNNDWNDFDPLA